MKLGIITHKVIKGDGQGRVNYEVALEAIRRDHAVTLVATEVDSRLLQNSLVTWIPITLKNLPIALLRNIAFSQQSTTWLRQHHHQLDLIMANGANTNFYTEINAVHFVHSSWLKSPYHIYRQRRDLYGFYQWFYTALNAYFERKVFSHSQTLVAVSNTVKQDLLEMGIPEHSIKVITNGVDLQEFSPGISNRKTLSLPENVTLALFVGDIRTPRKNLDTILKALVQVPHLHLAVIGSVKGSPYPILAANLAVQERVHFLGYRQDVAEVMKACDFFVFPSRYETFGLVILEAMATGLPVITASTTGAAELVTPESGIVLSNPDDIQLLVKALITLSDDKELRNNMGQAAREIATLYSWKNVAENYVNLFEQRYFKQSKSLKLNSI